MNRIAQIAAAAALTGAIALPASQAAAATKTENALIGAAVGALAGSLLSHGSTEGVIAGAAVGGLVGIAADKPDHYRYGRPVARARYEDRRAYRAPTYRADYAPVYRDNYAPVYRDEYGYGRSYGSSYGAGYGSSYVPTGYRYGY